MRPRRRREERKPTKQSEFVIAGRFDYSNGQIHMHSPVMAGLDPAIHVFVSQKK